MPVFELAVPPRPRLNPAFEEAPQAHPLERGDDRRHRELLHALGQIGAMLAEQDATDDSPAPVLLPVPAAAPALDPVVLAAAISAALGPLLAEHTGQTEKALTAVIDRLKKVTASVAMSGGGPSGTSGISNEQYQNGVGQITALLPDLTGTWGYVAGASGTPSLPSGARVLAVTAHATSAASMTINGGDSIPIPANTGFGLDGIFGQITAPTLVFTGTDSYCVSYLT